MRKKPICLIYGHDGFDPCALLNLYKFYQSLGFAVLYTQEIEACNLLVVKRGQDINIPSNFPKDIPVHLYSYVGTSIKTILQKLINNGNPCSLFAPSSILLDESENSNVLKDLVYPPVIPKYWIEKRNVSSRTKYNLVHIGNKKTKQGAITDLYADKLNKLIETGKVDLWGFGWDKNKIGTKYHGYLSIYNVPFVYSRTDYALGLMYPFQRDKTFSGRFYQAPLNGVILLSEPGLFANKVPGVTEADLSDIEAVIRKQPLRQEIAQESFIFWSTQTEKLKKAVCKSLSKYPPYEQEISRIYAKTYKSNLYLSINIYKSRIKKLFI